MVRNTVAKDDAYDERNLGLRQYITEDFGNAGWVGDAGGTFDDGSFSRQPG